MRWANAASTSDARSSYGMSARVDVRKRTSTAFSGEVVESTAQANISIPEQKYLKKRRTRRTLFGEKIKQSAEIVQGLGLQVVLIEQAYNERIEAIVECLALSGLCEDKLDRARRTGRGRTIIAANIIQGRDGNAGKARIPYQRDDGADEVRLYKPLAIDVC